MTEKNKEKNTEQNTEPNKRQIVKFSDEHKQKKFSSILRNIIFIFFVLLLGLFLQQKFFNSPYNNNTSKQQITDNKDKIVADSELVKDALNEAYSVGPEPPIFDQSPEKQVIDTTENDVLKLEDDDEDDDEYAGCLISIDKELLFGDNYSENKLTKYRLYLVNANNLIIKFYADKVFSKELKMLKTRILPEEVIETLFLLEKYNKTLRESEKSIKIKPIDSKLFDTLIKIQKLPNNFEQQQQFKNEIKPHLVILMNYIFSSELQKEFID